MIVVSLLGTDSYEVIEKTKKLHKGLKEIYSCSDDELEFFAPTSFLIHDGVEQTFYHLNIRIEAPSKYKDYEKEVVDYLRHSFNDMAVHLRILFTYFDEEQEYIFFDKDYPTYMSESNTVKVGTEEHEEDEEDYEEEYDEPYMGDILSEFDNYIREHPDATNREVYEALSGIREDIKNKHHETKEEN